MMETDQSRKNGTRVNLEPNALQRAAMEYEKRFNHRVPFEAGASLSRIQEALAEDQPVMEWARYAESTEHSESVEGMHKADLG